jgi:transposase
MRKTIGGQQPAAEQSAAGNLCAVGIDVSKENLSICLDFKNGSRKFSEIRNSEAEIARFAKSGIAGYQGKIVMESTGRYHCLPAVILAEQGFDARVINPLLAKKYFTSSIRKVKSDKKDSEVLAEIAAKEEKLPNRFSLDRSALEIRRKISLLGSLEKQTQQLTATMSDHNETKKQLKIKPSSTEKEIMKTIAKLKKLKQDLEKEIIDGGRREKEAAEKAELYGTIPGVSGYLSVLAAIYFSADYQESSKQWIAFSGLDVSVKQSGKWTGKGKLTKRGNAYLRKRLFSAAWGAMMHDEQFRKYYDYLRKDCNRKYKEALVIISKKIVRIMFELAKSNTVYDPNRSRLFNLPSAV